MQNEEFRMRQQKGNYALSEVNKIYKYSALITKLSKTNPRKMQK